MKQNPVAFDERITPAAQAGLDRWKAELPRIKAVVSELTGGADESRVKAIEEALMRFSANVFWGIIECHREHN
jgi:hypothetical protein